MGLWYSKCCHEATHEEGFQLRLLFSRSFGESLRTREQKVLPVIGTACGSGSRRWPPAGVPELARSSGWCCCRSSFITIFFSYFETASCKFRLFSAVRLIFYRQVCRSTVMQQAIDPNVVIGSAREQNGAYSLSTLTTFC